jgi:dihydrofolate synthase/folylpolyglutamate synthase
MDYRSAADYIMSFADYERAPRSAIVFDLRRIFQLLERLGNPQAGPLPVHVAGTKGKGSTAAMIASILDAAGCRTGLYTSPHIFSINERIQFNGKPISGEDFARLVETLRPEVEAVNRAAEYGRLTTFELLTALAFIYFRERKAVVSVLEAGLGGRLDATNVVGPGISVITSISYDHTNILGNTLAKIAGEKAGIIKPGSVVVSAPQSTEAMVVIESVCRERGVRLLRVGEAVTWRPGKFNAEGQRFELAGLSGRYDLVLPLLGEYQMENAAAAVASVELLADRGVEVTGENIVAGLARVRWPGRLQVLRKNPRVIVDCAHNAYSIGKLVAALYRHFSFNRVTFVLGVSADKDIAGIVAELAAVPADMIVTCADHPRALQPDLLAAELSRWGMAVREMPTVVGAVDLALTGASAGDLVCITGSIFVVAEAMTHLANAPGKAGRRGGFT